MIEELYIQGTALDSFYFEGSQSQHKITQLVTILNEKVDKKNHDEHSNNLKQTIRKN